MPQNEVGAAFSLPDDAAATPGGLVARDETNNDWLRPLALARWGRARVLLAAQPPLAASRDAARATMLLQSLLDKFPEDRRSRTDLAEARITPASRRYRDEPIPCRLVLDGGCKMGGCHRRSPPRSPAGTRIALLYA